MKIFVTLLLAILVCPLLSANVGNDVSGRVPGHDGESIPYAYVAICNDARKVIQTGVTNNDGRFYFQTYRKESKV